MKIADLAEEIRPEFDLVIREEGNDVVHLTMDRTPWQSTTLCGTSVDMVNNLHTYDEDEDQDQDRDYHLCSHCARRYAVYTPNPSHSLTTSDE